MEQQIHIGRNISKIRELLGIKQEVLATHLNVSQQTVSKIEQTKQLSHTVIERIALALDVPATSITQYDERIIVESLKGSCNLNKADSKYVAILEQIVTLFGLILELEQRKPCEQA